MSPAQLRMARAALRWSQAELAERSGVFINTIKAYESGASDPKRSTQLSLKRALSKVGIEFIDDNGVRLREPQR